MKTIRHPPRQRSLQFVCLRSDQIPPPKSLSYSSCTPTSRNRLIACSISRSSWWWNPLLPLPQQYKEQGVGLLLTCMRHGFFHWQANLIETRTRICKCKWVVSFLMVGVFWQVLFRGKKTCRIFHFLILESGPQRHHIPLGTGYNCKGASKSILSFNISSSVYMASCPDSFVHNVRWDDNSSSIEAVLDRKDKMGEHFYSHENSGF